MSDLPWLQPDGVPPASALPPWRVLVVDDDPDVHAVTRLCLRHFRFEGRPLELLSAHSATEARKVLESQADIAMILLDVVMETDTAGLELARQIREEMKNHLVRIVLRTGGPGQAPPLEVTERYEVDDYRNKNELTYERLTVLTQTALRTHRLLTQLEERQRVLTKYNEDLEHFTRVASHDMKTPLRSIINFAQLVEQRCAQRLEPKDREMLQFVVNGGHELHALIEGMLEYATVGRAAITPQPVDLNGVVRKACEALRTLIDRSSAKIDFGSLPTIPGDAGTLELLFHHLIENSIKFQPGPAPTVNIDAVRSAADWEIRISDRGVGVEAQYLEKIFEPFQRLYPPDRFPGSGIGLAVCKKVAQLHKGSIHAESRPQAGTTIVVRLPAD